MDLRVSILLLLGISQVFGSPFEPDFLSIREQTRSAAKSCSEFYKSCYNVEVNREKIRSSPLIEMPGYGPFLLKRTERFENVDRDVFVFQGQNDKLVESAIFAMPSNGEFVRGEIRLLDHRTFILESCGVDCHVWMELDRAKAIGEEESLQPPEHVKQIDKLNKLQRKRSLEKDSAARANYEISIMTYYTEDLLATMTEEEIKNFVSIAITTTNQGYINSAIPITLKLHCQPELAQGLVEDDDLLPNFVFYKGSATATKNSADIATIFMASGCGQGYLNTPYYAFSKNSKLCVEYQYTLGHEIGHNYGCHHNRETGAVNPDHPYGYGFWMDNNLRTMLAYYGEYNEHRINGFSSPYLTANGNPLGDSLNDNREVVLSRMYLYASEGDESSCSASSSDNSTLASTTVGPDGFICPSSYGYFETGVCESKFIVCDNFNPIEMECAPSPELLAFDEESVKCQWRQDKPGCPEYPSRN